MLQGWEGNMKIYKLYAKSRINNPNFQKLDRNILSVLSSHKDNYEYVIYDYKHNSLSSGGVAVFKSADGKFALTWLKNRRCWDAFSNTPLEDGDLMCTHSLEQVMRLMASEYLFRADEVYSHENIRNYEYSIDLRLTIDRVLSKLNEVEKK